MKKIYVTLLIVALFAMVLSGCGKETTDSAKQTVLSDTVEIQTAYGTLQFPADMAETVKHIEVQEGSIAMEIFSMEVANGEMELFRIFYADPTMGEQIGTLTIEEKKIPVSYTVCEYNEEDFPDEETLATYHELMKAFNTVLLSITEDERFLPEGGTAPVTDIPVKLKYWNTTVKENMEWEETTLNGIYQVDFYGNVSGERIPLYTIALGVIDCDSILGVYNLDGEELPICLKVHALPEIENWPEEAQNTLYRMMDTMNNIISVIMEDKNYAQGAAQ